LSRDIALVSFPPLSNRRIACDNDDDDGKGNARSNDWQKGLCA